MRMDRFTVFLGIATCITVAGCGKGNFSKTVAAGEADYFRYPLAANPTQIDPAMVQDGDTIDVTQQIFEGLVRWGQDNKIHPQLAESWDVKNGGRTYIFHIRKGVKFSNGDPLDANAFKFSIERAADPAMKSETVSDYLSPVIGVVAKRDGKASDVSGVKVIDPYTLEIDIDKPRTYFLGDLTYPDSFAVDPKVAPPQAQMLQVNQMIGTGPFIATNYVEDQVFTMKANPNYWGGKPKIAGIERPILKDAVTRLDAFKNNQVDLVSVQRQDVEGIQNDPSLKNDLHFFNRPATWYIGFNQKVYPPFADVRVRQAFTEAIDAHAIVSKDLGGLEDVATGILPPGVEGYRKEGAKTLPFNPTQAKALLAAAGYPDGKGLPELDLYCRNDLPDVKIVALQVQADLSQNLNVNCQVRAIDWTTFLAKDDDRALPFFHMRWEADYLDPQDFISTLLTTSGPENKMYFSNAQVDALCATADILPDTDARRIPMYQQAEDICLQQAAWAPIYFQKDAELISPRVHGLRESIFGHLPHTQVSLSK